jgi:hypothetical protein
MEEMTKEELLAMFQKVREQTIQIAKEKKLAQESLEVCTREKDEIRSKALVIIQRCKDLEEKQSTFSMLKSKCESYVILFAEQEEKIKLLEEQLSSKFNVNKGNSDVDPEDRVTELTNSVHSLEMQLQAAEALLESQDKSHNTLNEETSAMQSLVKYLESELVNKEVEIKALHDNCASSDLRVTELTAELTALQDTPKSQAKTEKALLACHDTVTLREKEIEALQKKVQHLGTELDAEREKSARSAEQLEALRILFRETEARFNDEMQQLEAAQVCHSFTLIPFLIMFIYIYIFFAWAQLLQHGTHYHVQCFPIF